MVPNKQINITTSNFNEKTWQDFPKCKNHSDKSHLQVLRLGL